MHWELKIMTNSIKPTADVNKDDHSFDGITFEVEEEEQTNEGQKVKRRGIYLWPNLITTAALLSGFYSIIASMNGNFTQAIYAIFLANAIERKKYKNGEPSLLVHCLF